MTERKPLEPVAWRRENPAFTAYDNVGYPPVEFIWTDEPNIAALEGGWTPVYTASQIRSLVEEVRAEYTLPDPAMSPDMKLTDHAVRNGARSALDAILARLEK